MKLDCLADGAPDCPLVRLYDFSPADSAQLLATLTALASGAVERVEVNSLPFVEPLRGCRVFFVRRPWDQAIIRGTKTNEFECGFTVETWNKLAGLVEPFAQGGDGFQWLAGVPGDVALLLTASVSGQW